VIVLDGDKSGQDSDPMKVLPDIEQPQPTAPPTRQMTADEHLMILKAPLYKAKMDYEIVAETIINQLWASLKEKNAIIRALQQPKPEEIPPGDQPPGEGSIPDDTHN